MNETFSAPRYAFERKLFAVWREVLERDDFGIHDSFFDLGGSSLDAIRLLARIRNVVGLSLTFGKFTLAPTISGSAALLRSSATGEPSALIPMKTGSRPPLFCVHPMGGSVVRYLTLAQALDEDVPVYGLQSLGLVGTEHAHNSIPEIATMCADEILKICPDGPFQVLGYSFGGMVAFETAQQILDRTGRHSLVVIVDMSPCEAGAVVDAEEIPAAVAVAANSLRIELDPVDYRGLEFPAALHKMYDAAVACGVLDEDFPLDSLWHMVTTFDSNKRALQQYRPDKYPGELVVFCGDPKRIDDSLGWGAYARSVRSYPLETDHFAALEERGSRRIAGQLSRYLAH
jgi:thioesterase domain-containing protein